MEKKVAKKPAKTTKVEKEVKPVRTTPAKKAVAKPAVKPVEKVEKVEKPEAVQPVQQEAKVKKPVMLNQELNLLIGLFALLAIGSFCFTFQGGSESMIGWELLLKGSGVFKGLMILYVVSIFVDCILAVRIDTENEVVNLIEKALYMFTLVINVVVVAILYSLISAVGIGLVIFLIVSIISAIVKLARIYAQNK